MRINLPISIIIILVTTIVSCSKKINRISSGTNEAPEVIIPPTVVTPPTPTPDPDYGQGGPGVGHGEGTEIGVADAGQTQNFYTTPPINLHGSANNPNVVYPRWSSEDLDWPQSAFITDQRFNVRVRVRPGPSKDSLDFQGEKCKYSNDIYGKLQVKLCVKSSSASSCTGENYQVFNDIPVNQVSKVRRFNVPATDQPLVVEIHDIQWEHDCIDYGQRGSSHQTGYCPWAPVWSTQCVQLEIQFSTDYTKDFSGPFY